MRKSPPLSPGLRFIFGLFFLGCGLVPLLASLDVGPLGHRDINGPPWLGTVAGGIFAVAGLMLWAGRLPPLASSVMALILCAGLAALGNWIAFGAGKRMCSGSLSIAFLWSEAELSGLACRIPFGIGALMIDGLMLVLAARTLQIAMGGPPRLARLVRLSDWAFFAALLPVLLPLLLLMIAALAGKAVLMRLRTGQWPRNEEFIARRNKGKPDLPQA